MGNAKKDIVIGKANVFFEYNGHTDGPELQQAVNDWWDKVMQPQIEAIAHSVGDDVLIRIPKITFDITTMAANGWQEAARDQILSGLQKEIQSRMPAGSNANSYTAASGMPDGTALLHKGTARPFMDEWLFFLQKGFIPWWSRAANWQEWKATLTDYVAHAATAAELAQLADHITIPVVADRLATAMQGTLLRRFLQVVSGWDVQLIDSVCTTEQVMILAKTTVNGTERLLHAFRKELIIAAVKKYAQQSVPALVKKLTRNDAALHTAVQQIAQQLSAGNSENAVVSAVAGLTGIEEIPADNDWPASKAGSRRRVKTVKDIWQRIFGDETWVTDTGDVPAEGKKEHEGEDKNAAASEVSASAATAEIEDISILGSEAADTHEHTLQQPGAEAEKRDQPAAEKQQSEEELRALAERRRQPEKEKHTQANEEKRRQMEEEKRIRLKQEMQAAAEEGVYIEHAGIVIVAAYFSTFFRNIGVAADDVITDVPRAVAMIHYLATGLDTAEEYEVVLPKILCGIAPADFVDTAYRLTDEDKAEADQLLEAVIANWDALKNTSPETLRTTFLMREGKLVYENDAWKLYVQETSFDILVKMIPWNIGMIYLPWMPSVLRVSWGDE
jgi:hypothetical protein